MKYECYECGYIVDDSEITMRKSEYDGQYEDVYYPFCNSCHTEILKQEEAERNKPKSSVFKKLFNVR